jgi:NAD(P)-dependent dehydrogenase (short-subunit alcohol dehydrogenase family)
VNGPNGLVAVVTGATRGIGLSIAQHLEEAGYTVVGTSRSGEPSCDIGEADDRERLLAYVLNRHGRVDLLVNNAGIAPAQRLDILETTEESFRGVLRTNLEGTFFMCQLFANQMLRQPRDLPYRIINIASISSYTSSVNRGEYCISKAGVSMVTQLFADRLAEYGIGVYEIRPGIIQTDMTAAVTEKYQKLIESIEAEREDILRQTHRKAVEKSDQLLFDARREAETIYNRVKAELQLERDNLYDEIKRQILDIAHLMAGRFVQVSLDREAQDRLIEQSLSEWDSGSAGDEDAMPRYSPGKDGEGGGGERID